MNSTSDAVLHFDIEFGDNVGLEGSVFLEILFGGCIDDVSDSEALDGLVFGAKSAAIHADDSFYESSVVFVAAVVSALDGHACGEL